MNNGEIVPINITCKLIEKAIHNSRKNIFLLDGFPRNIENLKGFNNWLNNQASNSKISNPNSKSQQNTCIKVAGAIYYVCSKNISIERVLARGETKSARSDDNLPILEKRFDGAYKNMPSVLRAFREDERNPVRVMEIPGEGLVEKVELGSLGGFGFF